MSPLQLIGLHKTKQFMAKIWNTWMSEILKGIYASFEKVKTKKLKTRNSQHL